MTTPRSSRLVTATLALLLCAFAPVGDIEPPVFTDPLASNNDYEPFEVGAVKVFAGIEDGVLVTHVEQHIEDTRTFLVGGVSIEAHTMLESTFENGVLVEVSRNFTAEADDGTVYTFGELVDVYVDGVVVSNDGSWLVGGPVDPNDPGDMPIVIGPSVFMPNKPEVGDEWMPEDFGDDDNEILLVLAGNQEATVPAGKYENAILIEEFSDSPDNVAEHKWYAPGVGVVKTVSRSGQLVLIASSLGKPAGGSPHVPSHR